MVDWDSAALNVTGLQVEEVEREEICSEIGLVITSPSGISQRCSM